MDINGGVAVASVDNTNIKGTARLRKQSPRLKPTSVQKHVSPHETGSSIRSQARWAKYLEKIELRFTASYFATLLVLDQFPQYRPFTAQFLRIQYINHTNGKADMGIRDVYFALSSLLFIILVRAVFVKYLLPYIAEKVANIKSKKTKTRFAEQMFNVIYFTFMAIVSFRLYVNSEYAWSYKALWQNWPHYDMDPALKAYYIFVTSYWFSQIYVIHVEKPRKDHVEMLTHHIITCFLCSASYYYYYTRVGHVIMLMMDVVDATFDFAKVLKYLGFTTACDCAFGVFLVSWIALRHVIFCLITWSAGTEALELIQDKCHYNVHTHQLVRCFSKRIHLILVACLCMLQVITLIWFTMILRVLMGILRGGSAEDNRSDDEGEEEEEQRDEK